MSEFFFIPFHYFSLFSIFFSLSLSPPPLSSHFFFDLLIFVNVIPPGLILYFFLLYSLYFLVFSFFQLSGRFPQLWIPKLLLRFLLLCSKGPTDLFALQNLEFEVLFKIAYYSWFIDEISLKLWETVCSFSSPISYRFPPSRFFYLFWLLCFLLDAFL